MFKVETDSFVLKWESGETLLVSGPWEEGGFDFGVLEGDMPWVQYEVVPRHQVAAVTRGGQEVLFDVPVSTVGAIAMTNDFRSARFARPVSLEWLHMGLTEFVMDLHSGEIHIDKTIKDGSFRRENYMLLDWQQRTWEVMRELGLSGRALGLSNDNSLLAFMTTNFVSIPVPVRRCSAMILSGESWSLNLSFLTSTVSSGLRTTASCYTIIQGTGIFLMPIYWTFKRVKLRFWVLITILSAFHLLANTFLPENTPRTVKSGA